MTRLPKMHKSEIRETIYRQISTAGKKNNCKVKTVNAVEDHIHVPVHFLTMAMISKLVKRCERQ
jgi:hypothetical protein